MNELAKSPNFGVTERKGQIITSSRNVATVFEKRHDHVLQTIRDAIGTTGNFAPDFSGTNFIESRYKNRGKQYPEYLLTKDGLVYTVMGFTGETAARFKVEYINEFNRMEEFIRNLTIAKLEFPELTDAIKEAHEEPKHYHFSNELNMINKIVLGMTAKQFKEVLEIETNSIRPHLTNEQIKAIEKLQKFDIGLLTTEPDYQKRKELLTMYYQKLALKALSA
jgi:Rha family phage regulatory protein